MKGDYVINEDEILTKALNTLDLYSLDVEDIASKIKLLKDAVPKGAPHINKSLALLSMFSNE